METSTAASSSSLRFGFGKNWRNFLSGVGDEQVAIAAQSIQKIFNCDDLSGLSLLDIGSGSGLFSLASCTLGARVHSFDYDPDSVACTQLLKERYYTNDPRWVVEQGSAIDEQYMNQLGQFDLVYSWGVLHHTGNLDKAMELACQRVKPGGQFFVSLYNDQGWISLFWTWVKRLYCASKIGEWLVKIIFIPLFAARSVLAGLIRHGHPLAYIRNYKSERGMSVYYDWIDWLGGYPFEVRTPDAIKSFMMARGFTLVSSRVTHKMGCNEFVFRKLSANAALP